MTVILKWHPSTLSVFLIMRANSTLHTNSLISNGIVKMEIHCTYYLSLIRKLSEYLYIITFLTKYTQKEGEKNVWTESYTIHLSVKT